MRLFRLFCNSRSLLQCFSAGLDVFHMYPVPSRMESKNLEKSAQRLHPTSLHWPPLRRPVHHMHAIFTPSFLQTVSLPLSACFLSGPHTALPPTQPLLFPLCQAWCQAWTLTGHNSLATTLNLPLICSVFFPVFSSLLLILGASL